MINHFILNQRFLFLLIFLLIAIAQIFIAEMSINSIIVSMILFYFIFLSIVYSISKRKLYTLIVALVTTITFSFNLINMFFSATLFTLLSFFGGIAFYGIIIITFLSYIFGERLVTRDMVYGAFVVYLLMGIVWSHIYGILHYFDPSSLILDDVMRYEESRAFLLYSFENLNLGNFGFVKPASGLANYFSMLQSLIAQIYMVVQVAWLINVYFSQRMSKNSHQR